MSINYFFFFNVFAIKKKNKSKLQIKIGNYILKYSVRYLHMTIKLYTDTYGFITINK